jgi:tetratricopeptide (TPR) repeat protein
MAALHGLTATAHGPSEERLAQLERELASAPDSAPLHLERAQLQHERGNRAAALVDLQRAAALDPSLAGVSRVRGMVLLDERAFPAAAVALGQYLEAAPDDASARAARARAWFAMDRPLEAAAEYTRVIAQRPTPLPEDYLARARALANAPRPRLE